MAETMTYQSKLISPNTDDSGEDSGRNGLSVQSWTYLSSESRREPESQWVGSLFPNINSFEYESEAFYVRCQSPRSDANCMIWKAVPIIIQDACSAVGAEGWQTGMIGINTKKIIGQVEKLNSMKC